MHPINRPEVMLANANRNIDENGNVTNEVTLSLVKELLINLVEWTKKINR